MRCGETAVRSWFATLRFYQRLLGDEEVSQLTGAARAPDDLVARWESRVVNGGTVRDAAGKDSCKVVLSIEMSMGQMVEDIERSVKGKRPVRWYGKCGGDVPTPEEVMEEIRKLVK